MSFSQRMRWFPTSWSPYKRGQGSPQGGLEVSSLQSCASIPAQGWVVAALLLGLLLGLLDGFHGQHHSTYQPNPRTGSGSWRTWFIATPNIVPRVLHQHLMVCLPLVLPKREDMVAPWWKGHVVHWVLSLGTKDRHPRHTCTWGMGCMGHRKNCHHWKQEKVVRGI